MVQSTNAIEKYINHCRYEKNLNKLTLKAYRLDLDQFTRSMGSEKNITDFSRTEIQTYVKKLYSCQLKESSIKRKVVSLKAFYKFLEMEESISKSPFDKLNIRIRIPKRIPRYLSLNEVRLILQTANKHATQSFSTMQILEPTNSTFNAFQRLIIVELLFSTGLRVSELCSLNSSDVDVEKQTVQVFGKGSKERSVVITNPDLLRMLSLFLRSRSTMKIQGGTLLVNRRGRRIQPSSVRIILKALSREANMEKTTTPHMFRHTIATLLLENGVDIRFVQKFLGHSSILTTQMYTHLSTSAEREIIGNKHPRNFI